MAAGAPAKISSASRRIDLAGKIARRLGAKVSEQTVHAVDDVSITINGARLSAGGRTGCEIHPGVPHSRAHERRRYWRGNKVDDRSTSKERMKVQMVFHTPCPRSTRVTALTASSARPPLS